MATIPKRLSEVLDHYRLRWRAVQAAMGLFLALCAVVAGALLGVAADRVLLGAPKPLRTGILIAMGVVFLSLLVWRFFRPWFIRMPDHRTAFRLGSHFPEAAEDLVTGVELSEHPEDTAGVSKGLVDAALQEIDHRSETVSWREAVPLAGLLKAASVFIVLAGALAMACSFASEAVLNSIQRLFQPDTPFYSYTDVTVLTGDRVVRQGDALAIEFRVTKRVVSRATIEVRSKAESFAADVGVHRMTDGRQIIGAGAWQSGSLLEDITYRVRAGDRRSPWYTITTVPAPALTAKNVKVRFPEYIGRPEQTIQNVIGAVTIVQGSKVVIQILPAARGKDPSLVCTATMTDGKTTWPLTLDPKTGMLVSQDDPPDHPPLQPKANVEYKITLKDGYGLTSRAPDTLAIKVVPDNLPVVAIQTPGADVGVLPNATVPVDAYATDDFGVRKLTLHWRVVPGQTDAAAPAPAPSDEKWLIVPLNENKEGKKDVMRLQGDTKLALPDIKAKPGDFIEYYAEASDFADDAIFRLSRSATYRINIVSFSKNEEDLLRQLGDIANEIKSLALEQHAGAKDVGKLSQEAEKADKSPDALSAQQHEQELQDKLKELQRKMDDIMMKLADNPMTPAALMADMDRVEKALQDTHDKPMTQANNKLAKASKSKSGKPSDQQQQQQDDLKTAEQKEKEAADELDRISKDLARAQRRKLLDILADEAARLADYQLATRTDTGKTAVDVAGRTAAELPKPILAKVTRVAGAQKQIVADISTLAKDIERVFHELTDEKVSEAEKTQEALDIMNGDRTTETADSVASRISESALLDVVGQQLAVANSLKNVADVLRTDSDPGDLGKELAEFIKKQKDLNERMQKLIDGKIREADPSAPKPVKPPAGPSALAAPQPPVKLAGVVQGVAVQVAVQPAVMQVAPAVAVAPVVVQVQAVAQAQPAPQPQEESVNDKLLHARAALAAEADRGQAQAAAAMKTLAKIHAQAAAQQPAVEDRFEVQARAQLQAARQGLEQTRLDQAKVEEAIKALAQADGPAQPASAGQPAVVRQVSLDLSRPRAIPVAFGNAAEVKNVANKLGDHQGQLGQDVGEHAAAMRNLFKEYGLFKLETADLLDQASGEMAPAAEDLSIPELKEALEHGKKALALLEEAAKKLPEDQQQMDKQQDQKPDQMSMEEMMLLAKIIGLQKVLKTDTSSADRTKVELASAFPDRAMELARRQARIRYDDTKLARKLAKKPKVAQVVEAAGGKMDLSHSGLESGDAGAETRGYQSEAIQLLEALLKEQQGQAGSSASSAGQQAMQSMAAGGGGFRGGANGPLAPATIDAAGFNAAMQGNWNGKLGAGGDTEFPAEFRGLLNSYFDQVRKESR